VTGWIDFLSAAPSAETAAFDAALEAQLAELPASHEVPPEVTRQARAEGRGIFPAGGPLDTATWVAAPTPLGRVRVSLPDEPARGVYLHVHGGGWTLGAPEQYDRWNGRLARASGAAVVSVPYRLAPEHPWPACAEDVEAAAVWLATEGVARFGGGRIVIGGESAGAHLAMVAMLRLRARDMLARFAGMVLNYGVFDLRMTPSMANWGARKLVLSTPTVDWFVDNLTGGDRRLRGDPALSPLLADLSGLPPALLQVGTADPLLDDTTFMAMRLAACGPAPEVRVWPGGVHAFDMFDLKIAAEAKAAEAAFVRARLS
jgi:acetyl esterase/lipase